MSTSILSIGDSYFDFPSAEGINYRANEEHLELMQYTGVEEKYGKGKEIYEGDIVELKDGQDKDIYEIKWQQQFCGFGIDGFNVRLPKLVNEYDGLEIIGNIFESPELCKK